ncbi:MAG: hypothetical protein RMJ88_11950 [Thermogemmata sp.]|nr:hypothetical protein [Thermogemmata sp.]
MTRLWRNRFFLIVTLVGSGIVGVLSLPQPPVRGADRAVVQKQLAYLRSQLEKSGIKPVDIVETPHFLIAGTIGADKLRSIGAQAERLVPLARQSLELANTEVPWQGKLAVCYLPEPRDFRTFVREVLRQQPERIHYQLQGETPLLVTAAQAAGINTEAERQQLILAQIGMAFLRAREPQAMLPVWLGPAYGRVCALRADGLNSPRYNAYRNQARRLVREGRLKPTDLWSDDPPEQTELLATTVVEFLAFGPTADKFTTLLKYLRPSDDNANPSLNNALTNIGWTDPAAFEQAWRNWILGVKTPAPKEPPKKELPKKK